MSYNWFLYEMFCYLLPKAVDYTKLDCWIGAGKYSYPHWARFCRIWSSEFQGRVIFIFKIWQIIVEVT